MIEGVRFACVLDGRGGGTPLTAEQVVTSDHGDGVLWVHLDYQEPAAAKWLRENSGIPRLAAAALLDEDSRPRCVEFGNALLITLRGTNLNPEARPEDMVSVRVWLEPHRIITTRRRRVLSPQKIYDEMLSGHGPVGPGDFLVQLVEKLDSHLEPLIEAVEDEIEAAEISFGAQTDVRYAGEFGQLRRKTARLRRYLGPQRDTLERLSRLQTEVLDEPQRNRLREEADSITRQLEDLDLARERAMVAHEELLSRIAQEQNSRMYVLSIVAAIFLPLSFLTGLMGMNVAGLPGTENSLAFWVTVALMTIVAIGITVYFRYKRWL